MYIDFHTHKPIFEQQNDVLEVISAHEQLKYPDNYYTIGHHPWWQNEVLTTTQIDQLKLNLSEPNCLAIGECGLDKLKGATKAIQEKVFFQHIELANRIGTPIIIHCVQQYDQILNFKKKYGQTPWVIHGYRRNKILAKSLIDAVISLSVSPFEKMNESFVELLKYIPLDKFFIETDSDYSLNIIQRYAIIADIKQMQIIDLQKSMIENFRTFFSWKKDFDINNLIKNLS